MAIPKKLMRKINPHLSKTWTEDHINVIPPSVLDSTLKEKLLHINVKEILKRKPSSFIVLQKKAKKNKLLYEEWLQYFYNN